MTRARSLSRRSLIGGLAALAAPALPARAAPSLRQGGSQFVWLEPRRQMPALALTDVRGRRHTLAPDGRVHLLNFWASWCPPCREEMPRLEAFVRTIDAQRLNVAAISFDREGTKVVAPFLKRHGIEKLPVFVDPEGDVAYSDAGNRKGAPFALYGMPITYLVDRNGDIVGYISGAVDWLQPDAEAFLAAFMA
ncbi:thiol-disulfide isomerase/thioredoxin [Chelatococcus caeni]|uniref:Thiol-disulfide isomerase/thioredoxin n=1 Tax=Chelatococcus caeni TaxID=1348468 RepID=A0A840BXE3_9HYPH|nr:TlpA disulfide reductase family protein [Chelatococcus caeni]MBB4017640.1 thiol-disulfide isomerase/thioredoxin [Chelatococcus caeni]